MKIAAYYRVSTTRQAEHELSLADQERQAKQYCEQHSHELVREFSEPGASATTGDRPVFQEMIGFSLGDEHPVDAILVHSLSRFFRDDYEFEHYRRKLDKHGIKILSITQPLSDDPSGNLVRSILTKFDEYQSAETAKHVLRSMLENARQGYWNGAAPPFGYQAVEAGRKGERVKKRLEINPEEAELVRRIYTLYLRGEGAGPLGVTAIAKLLNGEGLRSRGRPFHVSQIHRILTCETYTGTHYFNKKHWKTKASKPKAEWEPFSVPIIITEEDFNRIQASLKQKNPRVTPPRVITGPTLLTGLLKCASCGGGMTISTGKSGQYAYYACSTCARMGKAICKGRRVPRDGLDKLVLDHLAERVFQPDRLQGILSELIDRSQDAEETRKAKLGRLRHELTKTESSLRNLYRSIEEGIADLSDSTLKDRINELKTYRDGLKEKIDLLTRQINGTRKAITPEKLERFSQEIRDRLFNGTPEFRRAYLRLFVNRIELDDREIRIQGSKSRLAKGIAAPLGDAPLVPSFEREWR
ncbi:MAG: recombinase family protein, partial [Alphaproteobacteria bacterium]|nr:recombinase family protein [Alphaproteobacteria bacterium]